jgi:hypothetical protein
LNYCWLVNTSGKRDGFQPIDLIQEHNVRDIKVQLFLFLEFYSTNLGLLITSQHTFAAIGPFADWDYIGKTSASIPCQRRVKDHVEQDINHFCCYKTHTAPEKEEDVDRLQASYSASQIHIKKTGRKLNSKDQLPDIFHIGSEASKVAKTVGTWASNRISEWSTLEDWTDY